MIPVNVVNEIEKFIAERKWGSLTLNFRNGKIENINRVDSVRVGTLKPNESKVSKDQKPVVSSGLASNPGRE